MITTSPHTSAVTHRPAEVGPGTLAVHALSRKPEHAMLQTRIGSFADGMTAQSGNAERTVGSFATGMTTNPERSRTRTGSFADGLATVSQRVRARIGSFADGMTADGHGDGVTASGADFAPGPVPAWHDSEDAVSDTASAAAQDAVAA
jgi:hypothetical protein